MRRILPARVTHGVDAAHEAAAPPHPGRPTAAHTHSSAPPRAGRARRRTALLAAAAALAVLGTACGIDSGPAPPRSPDETAIRQVFAPLGVAEKAVSVAACESGLNPLAGGPGATYKGLFQLGPHLAGTVDFYGGDWFDPLTNAQVARDLYLQGGWSAWPTCGRR